MQKSSIFRWGETNKWFLLYEPTFLLKLLLSNLISICLKFIFTAKFFLKKSKGEKFMSDIVRKDFEYVWHPFTDIS